MKRFMNKKVLVVGVAVAVFLGVGGAAFAYFTSTGSGTGSAQVATAVPVVIHQIGPVYDSTIALADYQYSQAFNGTQITQFGNEVTLASTGPLNNVVVAMTMCDGGCSGTNASVIPSYTTPITVNVYAPGNLTIPIATDTETTVTVPAVPVNTAAVPFNVTFSNFTPSSVALPSKVVYGVTLDALLPSGVYSDSTLSTPYCGGSYGSDNCLVGSLNVNLSAEPTNVSVGSDTYPGSIFVSSAQADAGGSALESNLGGCGAPAGVLTAFQNIPVDCVAGYSLNPSGGLPSLIPAVQINVTGAGVGELSPGGPSLPINFSITNPGSGNEQVQTVTISVASSGGLVETIPGDVGSAVTGCVASWFVVNGSPVAVNQNVPGGGTIDWIGTASISMTNIASSQDACQGINVGLNFTSN